MNYIIIKSPLGRLKIVEVNGSIKELLFLDEGEVSPFNLKQDELDNGIEYESEVLKEVRQELNSYFKGELREFNYSKLNLAPEGTDFQKNVWNCLIKIPHGNTISYKELATMAGSPKAFRAVGSANGKNPIPILIPCHRVISSDGSLGGYSLGLNNKKTLLKLEQE